MTTTVSADARDFRVSIPEGQLWAGAGDVLAVHVDGDLWWHPGLLTGDRVTVRPDSGAIATVNTIALSMIELPSGRHATEIFAEPMSQLGGGCDVLWAADGRSLVVLNAAPDWFDLLRVDAMAPFARTAKVRVSTAGRPPTGMVQFAGRGTNGEIAVVVAEADRTRVRFFDAAAFVERPALEVRLPATATAVQLGTDGRSVLWVDGDQLWNRSADGHDRMLGAGFAAAWFLIA